MVEDIEKAVVEADIVSAATLATMPIIKGSGCVPAPMSISLAALRPACARRMTRPFAGLLYLSIRKRRCTQAGDLVQPIKAGLFSQENVRSTLAALCRANRFVRSSDTEITLYKAVGTALADLAAATMVYEAAASNAER